MTMDNIGRAPLITEDERCADGLPRGRGTIPASGLLLTGKSFRPFRSVQDGLMMPRTAHRRLPADGFPPGNTGKGESQGYPR